jgi:hypothetical protein
MAGDLVDWVSDSIDDGFVNPMPTLLEPSM